jgi:hypothetical protein
MSSELLNTWEQVKAIADEVIFTRFQEHLKDVEIDILHSSWKNLTYEEMAENYHLSVNYLRGDIGHKLWQKLSDALGEKVTKNNFKEALLRAKTYPRSPYPEVKVQNLSFPEGFVSLDSPFYIDREGVEFLCFETIQQPGSLLRIKAPNALGKTSLIKRILDHAQSLDYQVIDLDLKSVNESILKNLNNLLRWLCWMVGHQARIENQLKLYWDTDILGCNDNCTFYFEEYLLPQLNRPLVLALDDVDTIFQYSEVTKDFFGMLRSWHEKGKILPKWKQLRLVIAHATEIYIPLDFNHSPFNAGIPIGLLEFDQEQVKALALLHGLPWSEGQIAKLMQMVGGHPHLVRLALYQISYHNLSLEQFLQEVLTEAGIYSNYLRQHLQLLQQAPDLAQAFKQVVTSTAGVELDSLKTYQLQSMGLVLLQANQVTPRCDLYREYFRRVL